MPITKIYLKRRGFDLGVAAHEDSPTEPHSQSSGWASGKPVLLSGLCKKDINQYKTAITQSNALYTAILNSQEVDQLLDQPSYSTHIGQHFDFLGSSINQGDEQEIETALFDATKHGQVVAEDLWLKVSWLSFYENDSSLRFRFSFGEDFVQDVAADNKRQHYAALLAEAVFPESAVITQNIPLLESIKEAVDSQTLKFVERIVYFNAPEGGAYLHHDRERGHAGVVYAQLTGATYWLALSKQKLLNEIQNFIKTCKTQAWPESLSHTQKTELESMASKQSKTSEQLETFANASLIHLINETPEFIQQLISNGYGKLVEAGDILLLPQKDELSCCWHSVFCIGDEPGQGLSFAIRID